MYADNTLTPREAIRLCALGTLALNSDDHRMGYDDLVISVRHFVSRITGPSLELMGESVELLRFEGLVEAINDDDDGENTELKMTGDGLGTLHTLLRANVRSGSSDLNELVIALKFRFLHLLPPVEQKAQVDGFMDACETELTRLEDLRRHHEADVGYLAGWLEHDIERLESRVDWLTRFRAGLDET